MTEQEYIQALVQRGKEKLEENAAQNKFEATVYTQTNNLFVYGRDYKNGDWVTAIDRQLGIRVDVQIVGITRSLTETGEITDLIFANNNYVVHDMDGGGGGGGDTDYIILPYQDTLDYMNSDSQSDFGYSTLTYAETMSILTAND